MAAVHILNQYIWPDAAPTAIYAEQLAVEIQSRGIALQLVGGLGRYRTSHRPKPAVPQIILPHWEGKRGNHFSTLREYWAVNRAFKKYIENNVNAGDVVVVTSAPPNTLTLHSAIHAARAVGVYWLQDYYPELIRGFVEYPRLFRRAASHYWRSHLAKWDHVVKAAGNLFGGGINQRILRNWPTLQFPSNLENGRLRTALYTGNLGYGHDVDLLIEKCRELTNNGYKLLIHADGPGVNRLPDWIERLPPFQSEKELTIALLTSEVHLISANPVIQHAVFPSKIWNSLAAGGRIVEVGFAGAMRDELHIIQSQPFARNLPDWGDFLISLVNHR